MTETAATDALFLGRQPILDRNQQLVAYELLFRSGTQNAASITDGVQATATVIVNAFTELALGEVLGSCRGFINVDEQFLFSDVLEILPRDSVVLEILETVPPTPAVVARCQELKALGFTLALDDVIQVGEDFRDLLALVEIVKVDIQPLSPAALTALAQTLKPLGKCLLAEKVDSREQMAQCMELGFSLFQGYYFAKPTIMTGKKLSPSQLSLIKLMNLVLSDADTAVLEAAFKPDPALTMNLLRLTNSVGAGMRSRITSLRHAITVLGHRQLQRWLQLLLFAGNQSGTHSPLLQLAATRGRFMELLAGTLRPGDSAFADQAFMAGILSLMPVLVGLPMPEILAPLGLAGDVTAALCTESGPLGRLLHLVVASEGDDSDDLARSIAEHPGFDTRCISRNLAQALAWARTISEEQGG